MKTALSVGMALAVGAFALLGTPHAAHAANANISGAVCRHYNAADISVIDFLAYGVRNLGNTPRFVVCPLVRSAANSTAPVNVYVDGMAVSGETISCTLYSYDYTGALLGTQSFPVPRTGTFDVYLTVPAKTWSTASVVCLLPASGKGILYDVDVVQ